MHTFARSLNWNKPWASRYGKNIAPEAIRTSMPTHWIEALPLRNDKINKCTGGEHFRAIVRIRQSALQIQTEGGVVLVLLSTHSEIHFASSTNHRTLYLKAVSGKHEDEHEEGKRSSEK